MSKHTLMMPYRKLLASLCFALLATAPALADETLCPQCGCEHGIRVIEVSRTICKMVCKQEPIKKTVYEKKEVPYCEHCLPHPGHHHVCPQCKACAKTRTVLVKKSIECGKKTVYECVPEVIKEQVAVPCTACGYCARHASLVPAANVESLVERPLPIATDTEPTPVSLASEPNLGPVLK